MTRPETRTGDVVSEVAQTVLTIIKEFLFLILSFRLTYLRRWASALTEGENLYLTFRVGWLEMFKTFCLSSPMPSVTAILNFTFLF